MMTASQHSTFLGQLVHNLQALETWLRVALLKMEPDQHESARLDFEAIAVGTELAANELTSYDDLASLVKKFNRRAGSSGKAPLSMAIVDLRDAIAHGRIVGTSKGYPLRLLKFSRQKDGQVRVVVNDVMDSMWFHLHLRRTYRAIELVRAEV